MCGERDGFGRRIMESSLLQSVLMKGARGREGGGLLRERGGYLKGLVVERKGRGR